MHLLNKKKQKNKDNKRKKYFVNKSYSPNGKMKNVIFWWYQIFPFDDFEGFVFKCTFFLIIRLSSEKKCISFLDVLRPCLFEWMYVPTLDAKLRKWYTFIFWFFKKICISFCHFCVLEKKLNVCTYPGRKTSKNDIHFFSEESLK